MDSFNRLLISLFLIVFVGACENARLSIANPGDSKPPTKTKPDCGKQVQTIGVYDSSDALIGTMTPWQGELSALDNYNYTMVSADVVIGPKGLPKHASHFFYENNDGLFLYIILDRFHGFKGNANVNLWMETRGNSLQDKVILSDEGDEMRLIDTREILEEYIYQGTFTYQEYGDGAVIGPFTGDQWEVALTYESATEIQRHWFADSLVGGMKYPMDRKNTKTLVLSPASMSLCQLPSL